MKRDRIMIWMFDAAPVELQRMHGARKQPVWVAFIPKEIHGVDLDEAIRTQSGPEGVAKYATSAGDAVYMGYSEVNAFLRMVAAGLPKDRFPLERSA